ncbi:MAG TPA: protein kinase [Gemmatirosa sp.]
MPRFGVPAELAELAGEYDVIEELGRGGSAIVYRAHDRTLGRDVAIKVVHPRPTSPNDDPVARLAREARMVAGLEHPGIVSVYAVRRLSAGGLTLVMQLVPGETLKTVIQRGGPLDPERAEAVLRDVAHALAYAHGRQVVHRDVKPENIFVHASGGRALISDFGIARSTAADSLTLTGTAIGTPFYMSPEQIEGRPVDGRSDLYSLGLVAWEMLTGRRPWDGESLYHVIYKQKHDDLPPIEAFRPDVPRRLQYIIERMLQKLPAARWAGAEGLLVQLDRRILPSDYAKWQAALPARIARHEAAVDAARAAAAPTPKAEVMHAATVRFSPALAQTHRLDVPGAIDRATRDVEPPGPPASEHDVATPVTADVPGVERSSALRPHAERPIQLPAYDSVAPTWSTNDSPRSRLAAPTRTRRVTYALGACVAVAGASAVAAFTARARPAFGDAASLIGSPGRTIAPSAPHVARAGAADPPPRPSEPAADHGVASPSASTVVTAIRGSGSGTPDLVAVGMRHACDLTGEGAAQCWGQNDGAQLGDGSWVASSTSPRRVAGVMTYTGVGAGASHTCGVTRFGDVYCWGRNESGQLGDGTMLSRTAPVRVGGAGVYRTVRGGASHTCALDITGVVRCWGDDSFGQLGDGAHTPQVLPTSVRLPAGSSAIAIATGGHHSCALLVDRRVICWGTNADGQLGIDSRVEASPEPVEVPGVRATWISAGDAHTCALLVDDRVQCWGRSATGQLGSGKATAGSPGRIAVLPTGDPVRAIAAGTAQSCALTAAGAVWCWGSTNLGVRPSPVQLARSGYVSLSVGATQVCAVTVDHAALCWRSVPNPASRERVWSRTRAGRRPSRPTQHRA